MHRQAVLVALATLSLVTATTTVKCSPPKKTPIPIKQCNTGHAQCCDSVIYSTAPKAATLLGLLGVVVQGVDVLVGLTCSPISLVNVGGGECNTHAVCCQENKFNGLINIGCTPIEL